MAALYSHVLAAEREQNDIDQSLDHIEQQQKDLSSTLDAYEKATQEVFGGHGGNLRALDTGPADTERDKKYIRLDFNPMAFAQAFLLVTCWQQTSIPNSTTYLDHSPK